LTQSNPGDVEGVVHFAYDLQSPTSEVETGLYAELDSWRTLLKRIGLIGQAPGRYDGFGFGNLSVRLPDAPAEFLITASQTSGVESLTTDELVRVTGFDLNRFWVEAEGTQPPASETLTHAMLYAGDERINWVMHAHSPEIWGEHQHLRLPVTPSEVPYGSPTMVRAVSRLLTDNLSRPLVFATLGHTDGVFACGGSSRDSGGLLVTYLARAMQLQTLGLNP
jgi:hypothetical protein